MFQHLTDDELLSHVSAMDGQPTPLELELTTRLAGAVDAFEELAREHDELHGELRGELREMSDRLYERDMQLLDATDKVAALAARLREAEHSVVDA